MRMNMGSIAVGGCLLAAAVLTGQQRASADVVIDATYVTTVGFNNLYPTGDLEGVSHAGDTGKGYISGLGNAEDRTIFEFSLSGVTLDSQSSVHFTPYVNRVDGSTLGNTPTSVTLYTFVGNGTPQISNGTPTGTALATTAPIASLGYLDFDVTSAVKLAAESGATSVGFLFVANNSGGAVEFNGGYFADQPVSQLVVSEVVPEPASLGMLALGAAMLLKRKK